jgi:hypothetical protein
MKYLLRVDIEKRIINFRLYLKQDFKFSFQNALFFKILADYIPEFSELFGK